MSRLLIIILIFTCCSSKKQILPERSEVFEVLMTIEDYDSLNSDYKILNRLSKNKLSVRNKDIKDTLIPQTWYSIDYSLLVNNLSSKINREIDSVFLAYQVDSMQIIYIDSTSFSMIKKSDKKLDYNCYEFYLPLFSNDRKKAFVQYHITLDNCNEELQRYVLEKNRHKWRVIKKM